MSSQITQDIQNTTCSSADTTAQQSSTSTTSSGMQAVFDLQGMIIELFEDAIENNSKNAEMTAKNGEAMVDSMNEQYEEIEKEEKEAEKKRKSHSIWGFIKGLFDLTKDIEKLTSDLNSDIASFQFQNIGDDMKNDVNSIKNNAAVVDLSDMGKLCFQVVKLVGDVGKNAATLNFNNVKSEAKTDFTKIEENPALSFAIQLLSYAAVAASLAGAVATGGALSFLVVAAITAVAMASTLNQGGEDILETLGVSKSLSDKIMSIPSFEDVANGMTSLLEPELKALGIPSKEIKILSDAATVLAVATMAGVTGNLGVMTMAFGTTLASLSEKIAKDTGATGLTATILSVGLAVAGAIITGVGSCAAAKNSVELSDNVQKVMAMANKMNYVSEMALGGLNILGGARTIDLGMTFERIGNIQSAIDLLTAQIKLSDIQLDNTSKQLEDIISQYTVMINNFGAVSAPAETTAWAMV